MSRGYASIGLHQPKFDTNVGGALRAAYCYNVSSIFIVGKRFRKQCTDTPSAWRHIPVIETIDLRQSIPYSCIPVAVELCESAESILNFIHPERALYIFGPEDGSVPTSVLEFCKHKIYIPTKTCMNLASTVNVVLYDRLLKQNQK